MSRVLWVWLAAIAAVLMPMASAAEPVQIRLPDDIRGQGWLFRDMASGACGVVTAAHVVEHADPRTIAITGRGGAEASVTSVKILSPTPHRDADGALTGDGIDAAMLVLSGPLVVQGCSGSVVGSTNLNLTLGRLTGGELIRFEAGEVATQTVDFVSSGSNRPNFLALKTHATDLAVAPGFSGSTVADPPERRTTPGGAPTPLAMVVDMQASASGTPFLAVRYDAIWSLVRRALASAPVPPTSQSSPSQTAGGLTVTDWSGETQRPECPPSNALSRDGRCPWRVRPLSMSNGVSLTLGFESGRARVRTLDLSVAGFTPVAGATASLEANPSGREEDWAYIGLCQTGAETVRCRFAELDVARLRISLRDLDRRELGFSGVAASP